MGLETLSQPAFCFFFGSCCCCLASSWMRRDDNETHINLTKRQHCKATPVAAVWIPKEKLSPCKENGVSLQSQNDASYKATRESRLRETERKRQQEKREKRIGKSKQVANWSKTNTNKQNGNELFHSSLFPDCWRSLRVLSLFFFVVR